MYNIFDTVSTLSSNFCHVYKGKEEEKKRLSFVKAHPSGPVPFRRLCSDVVRLASSLQLLARSRVRCCPLSPPRALFFCVFLISFEQTKKGTFWSADNFFAVAVCYLLNRIRKWNKIIFKEINNAIKAFPQFDFPLRPRLCVRTLLFFLFFYICKVQ